MLHLDHLPLSRPWVIAWRRFRGPAVVSFAESLSDIHRSPDQQCRRPEDRAASHRNRKRSRVEELIDFRHYIASHQPRSTTPRPSTLSAPHKRPSQPLPHAAHLVHRALHLQPVEHCPVQAGIHLPRLDRLPRRGHWRRLARGCCCRCDGRCRWRIRGSRGLRDRGWDRRAEVRRDDYRSCTRWSRPLEVGKIGKHEV